MSGKENPWEFFTLDAIANTLPANRANVEANWPHVAWALDDLGLWDVPTVVAALATIRVEVGSRFEPIHEYGTPADWAGYDGGSAYAGRGFIQLTHRYNYRTFGQKIGVDLVNNPDMALDPSVAAWVVAYYWRDHGVPNMQALAQDAWLNTWDWRPTRRYVQGALAGYDVYLGVIDGLAPLVIESAPPVADPSCEEVEAQITELDARLARVQAIIDRKPRFISPSQKALRAAIQ